MGIHTQHKYLLLLSNFTQGKMILFPSLPRTFLNPCFCPCCRCVATDGAAPLAPQQLSPFTSLTKVAEEHGLLSWPRKWDFSQVALMDKCFITPF